MEATRLKMQQEHNKRLEEEKKKIKEREQQKRLEKIERYERFHKPGPFYSANRLGSLPLESKSDEIHSFSHNNHAEPIKYTRDNFQNRHNRLLEQESLKIKQREQERRAEKIARFEKLNSYRTNGCKLMKNTEKPASSTPETTSTSQSETNYAEELRRARLRMQEEYNMRVQQERLKNE